VHDGWLWLAASIVITDMLLHRIMNLLHEVLNLTKEFGRKTSERNLVERMKKKFELIMKPLGYSITSINDPVVNISTQILANKVMRKFNADEVLVDVILLATQSAEGTQFKWLCYLCSEFLVIVARPKMRERYSNTCGFFSPLCWFLRISWKTTRFLNCR